MIQLPEPDLDYNKDWDSIFYSEKINISYYPKISIVIPSFNQGQYIERTIRCILLQNYCNLELVVVDGGSEDRTLSIIEKYNQWITFWVSEKDSGMYDALNKGFDKCSGEIMGWSPTGDLYCSGALYNVATAFVELRARWITSSIKMKCDDNLKFIKPYGVKGFSKHSFQRGMHFLGGCENAEYAIQQQSTFWSKELWVAAGGKMDANMRYGGDFELWARFFYLGAELNTLELPIGIFMTHQGQESVRNYDKMLVEQREAFCSFGGQFYPVFYAKFRNYLKAKHFFYILKLLMGIKVITHLRLESGEWKEYNRYI